MIMNTFDGTRKNRVEALSFFPPLSPLGKASLVLRFFTFCPSLSLSLSLASFYLICVQQFAFHRFVAVVRLVFAFTT